MEQRSEKYSVIFKKGLTMLKNYYFIFLYNSILTSREKRVIAKRFIGNKTYEDIAREFNVTRERIRYIEIKAVKKLSQYYPYLLNILRKVNHGTENRRVVPSTIR